MLHIGRRIAMLNVTLWNLCILLCFVVPAVGASVLSISISEEELEPLMRVATEIIEHSECIESHRETLSAFLQSVSSRNSWKSDNDQGKVEDLLKKIIEHCRSVKPSENSIEAREIALLAGEIMKRSHSYYGGAREHLSAFFRAQSVVQKTEELDEAVSKFQKHYNLHIPETSPFRGMYWILELKLAKCQRPSGRIEDCRSLFNDYKRLMGFVIGLQGVGAQCKDRD